MLTCIFIHPYPALRTRRYYDSYMRLVLSVISSRSMEFCYFDKDRQTWLLTWIDWMVGFNFWLWYIHLPWSSNGLKIEGCQYYLDGIICPLGRDRVNWNAKIWGSNAGRWKTLGVPVVIGGDNLPSPVQIGLTDLQNIGGASQWCRKVKNIGGTSSNRWG